MNMRGIQKKLKMEKKKLRDDRFYMNSVYRIAFLPGKNRPIAMN